MATTATQVDDWLRAPTEHQRLEFKEAKNSYDAEKLHKYCVALANEGGGHLLLGVTDKPPRQVVGTQAFSDLVDKAEKIFTAVGFRVDIEPVDHPKGRVLVFHIPTRPRGSAYSLGGAYWMRNGEQLIPMSEDRLRTIFAEGAPDWVEEAAIRGLDAEQVVGLLDVQTFFELLKTPQPSNREGTIDRLLQERLIDQEGEKFSIRRLGALLLARRLSDFPLDVARKAARVVVYQGPAKLNTKLDHGDTRGYAVGFQSLVELIMNQLPQNEVIQQALRANVKMFPEASIRELVANALIHQDLTISGMSVVIEIYSDRIEISNPGEPIVAVERIIDGYRTRNERMADLMRRFGICEEKGSGIDRVVANAEFYQLPAPDFRSELQRTRAIMFRQRPFEDMDRTDRIRACYQHCVLCWVMARQMTNQTLRDRFKLSESKSATISQVISGTIGEGKIKLDGAAGNSRKNARYLPYWA